MLEISLFNGIRITLYYQDHNPPHFCAQYGNDEAYIDILEGVVLKGYLPRKQLRMVFAWADAHTDELMQNWELGKSGKEMHRIAPPLF